MNLLVVLATLIASSVEWVEALTIVLAVGLYKGWRSAMVGTVSAGVALIAIVATFGLAVTSVIPITMARTLVGFFLLVFGLRWLAKSVMRAAGLKSTRDEAEEFEKEREYLEKHHEVTFWNLDRAGVGTSFSGAFLEGLEVVFIVIALGGLNGMPAAITGAGIGLVAVVIAGLLLRQPLTRVPENAMKYVVGVMLTAFGTFFAGEGVGVQWWRDDLVLLPLLGIYIVASLLLIAYLRRPVRAVHRQTWLERAARAVWSEIWGLLIGDSAIAIVALAVLFGVGFHIAKVSGADPYAQWLMVLGILAAVIVGIWGSGVKRKVAQEPLQSASLPEVNAEVGPADGDGRLAKPQPAQPGH